MEQKNSEKIKSLLDQMQYSGDLPAISENVRDICHIARQPDTCAVDLATVIMRDCGLTSNILTTANSSMYSPICPIKTVSSAVAFLGFEKVCSMALGLSLFRQTMKSAKTRQLGYLYASSYFAGTFAMALAREYRYRNPEEVFVAGLLYRLPWLALANAFPDKFSEMERLIMHEHMDYNNACMKVFDVEYTDLCEGLRDIYNLPDNVTEVLMDQQGQKDPLAALVRKGGHIANMLFGDRLGGKEAIEKVNEEVGELLRKEFSLPEFIKDVCRNDDNVHRFFKLEEEDVEMMVNALEWGKGNPAHIASMFMSEAIEESVRLTEESEEPELMVGHFLTELMIACRRKEDVNHILMLAHEAVFKCLSQAEIFTFFLNSDRTRLVGRFYVGNVANIYAKEFVLELYNKESPLIRSVVQGKPGKWKEGGPPLHVPAIKKYMHLKSAIFCPIFAKPEKAIGLCLAGRQNDEPFNEREMIWLEETINYVNKGFQDSNKDIRHIFG